jgi:hypothetical protein
MGDIGFAQAFVEAEPHQLLGLERDAGYGDLFTNVDHLAANVLSAAITGDKTLSIERGTRGIKNADTLTLLPLFAGDRTLVDQTFALPSQQARGRGFSQSRPH